MVVYFLFIFYLFLFSTRTCLTKQREVDAISLHLSRYLSIVTFRDGLIGELPADPKPGSLIIHPFKVALGYD